MQKESILQNISNELSAMIENASQSIVLVEGKKFPASGIVWQKNFIVTADHLLPRSREVQVMISNSESITGSITGRDPATDIAIIQVSKDLHAFDQYSEQAVKTGELVVILGRANGGRQLAVLTMISGTDDKYKNWRGGTLDQFIRLDTGSFPGFSGSALVSSNGKLIGMNTSVFSRHFGLTIPQSNIERLLQRLAEKGSIGKPFLGLMMQPIRLPEKLRKLSGAEIAFLLLGTENDSPAEQAGLFVGDIVVRMNGKNLNSLEELHDLLTPESIGTEIGLSLLRGGKLEDVRLKVGERPFRQ
ncbi:MAG TPA: S1C family serine protease [Acidobacteriota bacterium]|nr:S1C family serine protease [Acidobacteriota bacterium]